MRAGFELLIKSRSEKLSWKREEMGGKLSFYPLEPKCYQRDLNLAGMMQWGREGPGRAAATQPEAPGTQGEQGRTTSYQGLTCQALSYPECYILRIREPPPISQG